MVRSTSAASIFSMASSRPMCAVTWITRSFGASSISETSLVPVSFASSSVCPGNLWPAAFIASLLIGAVQIASIERSRASCTARSI